MSSIVLTTFVLMLLVVAAVEASLLKKAKPFLPIIGYYAVMLAPIYGTSTKLGNNQSGLGGMTDFSTVVNRGGASSSIVANEYIVAPRGVAPRARVVQAPEYTVPVATLEQALDKAIAKQPRITFIAEDKDTMRKEWVQRSLIFRFPDVITAKLVPLGADKSSIAIHSYSVYGAGDLGVNAARVKSILSDIDGELQGR